MMPEKYHDEGLRKSLAPLINAKAWNAELFIGSTICIDFGQERPYEGDASKTRGTWRLVTVLCEWRIEKDRNLVVGSENSRENIKIALRELNGLVIKDIQVQRTVHDRVAKWMGL